ADLGGELARRSNVLKQTMGRLCIYVYACAKVPRLLFSLSLSIQLLYIKRHLPYSTFFSVLFSLLLSVFSLFTLSLLSLSIATLVHSSSTLLSFFHSSLFS